MDRCERKKAETFWENRWENKNVQQHSLDELEIGMEFVHPYLKKIQGKKVLDLGCGDGSLSVLLACYGANVTAVDMSEKSIDLTKKQSDIYKDLIMNHKGSISTLCMDALEIDRLPGDQFDFVFGRMVLHHIEPFDLFARNLSGVVKRGGVLVFYENSSNNALLIFFRTHLVGRFGVPRYGDGVEVPLQKSEVDELRKYFKVKVTIPKLVLFSLLGSYIFRKEKIERFFDKLDVFCFERFPFMRRWSYHQLLTMKKI